MPLMVVLCMEDAHFPMVLMFSSSQVVTSVMVLVGMHIRTSSAENVFARSATALDGMLIRTSHARSSSTTDEF